MKFVKNKIYYFKRLAKIVITLIYLMIYIIKYKRY